MKKIINRTTQLIFAQQGGIFSSAIILSLMIIVSRVFGFLRYRILAGYFTKGLLDVFFASFRIPDLIFEILITGAFTTLFIPIFIKYQKDPQQLTENISSIFNLIVVFLTIFILVLLVFMDYLIPLITPGFSSEKIAQIIFYSRLLLIGQLPFLVLGNFLTGIAQANKVFMITAIAPVIYNIVMIVFILLFANGLGLMAAVCGIIVGAILFFLIQLPVVTYFNFVYKPVVKLTQGVKEFFSMVIPRVMTVIFTQIDATIDLTLTSLLGVGSYTVFYLAQHLQLLPVSVVGIAFGQASLPYLSDLYENKKIEELRTVIINSILNIFFFTIPIMGLFVFARTPIVRIFFGGEKFDWEATVQTATTLSYFSLSLPFHSIYYFVTRCYYALLDSKTPFLISVFSILINTGLSLFFVLVLKLPVWSLALSFSGSIIINVIVSFILLDIKIGQLDIKRLIWETNKIMLVTIIASLVSYASIRLMDELIFDTTRAINVFFLLVVSTAIFFTLYLFLSWIFEVKEFYLVGKLLIKVKEYQKRLVEIYSVYE